ncbi:CRISPR-associated helicase Cas3' [Treponema primitia]|uniref:CRISPR-associated helicase Cas3' n=1 Tax=Treponema primitia TaxID=88058 RepID=UPI000474F007|nr:CRISPR-associated helicase Cas3' [Treponema primitia]
MAQIKNISSNANKILPLSSCLAKTLTLPDNKTIPGIDVFGHCIIVGEVTKLLVKYSIPQIRGKLFPPGVELVAAVHDLGKICPTFAEKLYRHTDNYQPNSLTGLENANPDLEKQWGYHSGLSQSSLSAFPKLPKYIPEIAGRHHGYSPDSTLPADSDYFGGKPWQKLRVKFVEKLKRYFGVDWPVVQNDTHAALLSGLTSVADWIGSGQAFDGFRHIEDITDLPNRVKSALDAAGFVPPLIRRGLSFMEIFRFEPNPIQARFIETISGPGVYVLEAPMGIGKTEAALYGAYKLLAARKASGIYFALPTRLTSEKIYERVNPFLLSILEETSPLRQALLIHGSAWLYETEMGEDAQPEASWFHAKKRSILAPFGVGTIDQALMAVMNVKHGFVRTFGLAGKVVILDEVHSYDSYTGTLMEKLVADLRNLGCTVIILSATLTGERRKELLGIKKGASLPAYPLISYHAEDEKNHHELLIQVSENVTVELNSIQHDDEAVNEALKRAEQGQQVLWIENTVAEAQDRFALLNCLAVERGVECGLIHSRFTKNDRDQHEKYWVTLFGKDAKDKRKEKGRILVGTQVLEQSLDIDADFLVTRLCPMDMLLQRIGRLWRHASNKKLRPGTARQEVWILSPGYEQVLENYKKELGKTAFVYAPYVLLRTLEVLKNHAPSLKLPEEIRPLVEAVYCNRKEDGLLVRLQWDLEKRREQLQGLARQGLSQGGRTLPESKAETRYSDQLTVDVLLLKDAKEEQNGKDKKILLVLSDGTSLELIKGLKNYNKKEWHRIAVLLNHHVVTVPEKRAPLPASPGVLDWFKEYIYIGNKEEEFLRVAIINKSENLVGLYNAIISKKYTLSYNSKIGYRSEEINPSKKEEEDW